MRSSPLSDSRRVGTLGSQFEERYRSMPVPSTERRRPTSPSKIRTGLAETELIQAKVLDGIQSPVCCIQFQLTSLRPVAAVLSTAAPASLKTIYRGDRDCRLSRFLRRDELWSIVFSLCRLSSRHQPVHFAKCLDFHVDRDRLHEDQARRHEFNTCRLS